MEWGAELGSAPFPEGERWEGWGGVRVSRHGVQRTLSPNGRGVRSGDLSSRLCASISPGYKFHREATSGQNSSAPRAAASPSAAAHWLSLPKSSRQASSRRVKRCNTCSRVKPMAPCTWWAMAAPPAPPRRSGSWRRRPRGTPRRRRCRPARSRRRPSPTRSSPPPPRRRAAPGCAAPPGTCRSAARRRPARWHSARVSSRIASSAPAICDAAHRRAHQHERVLIEAGRRRRGAAAGDVVERHGVRSIAGEARAFGDAAGLGLDQRDRGCRRARASTARCSAAVGERHRAGGRSTCRRH